MTKSGVGIRSWGLPSKKVEQRGPVLDRRPCGYGPHVGLPASTFAPCDNMGARSRQRSGYA
jgi:hypothetical protein